MVTATTMRVQAFCFSMKRFVACMQAAQITMPLEKRFGKRLQQTTVDDAELSAAPLQKRGRPVGKYQGAPGILSLSC